MRSESLLKSADQFGRKKYPNLRRMANLPITGTLTTRHHFTPKAAKIVEERPEVILHHQLYNDGDKKRTFLYLQSEQLICAVHSRTEMIYDTERRQAVLQDNICVYSPEEIPDNAETTTTELAAGYPHLFLPFDLSLIKAWAEYQLAQEHPGFISEEHAEAIYMGSSPFASYQTFHYLTQYTNELAPRIAGLRRILEVGAGLGAISFILSRLLPHAEVRGIEIDQNLVQWQGMVEKILSRRFKYEFPNLEFRQGDILSPEPGLVEGFDAIVGWFPLGHNIPDARMVEVFQRLRKGALVFQLYTGTPLSIREIKKNEALGFRYVEMKWNPLIAYHIFERI